MNRSMGYSYHQTEKKPRKLLDQVRDLMRRKHYSPRTEKCYIHWMRRYILASSAKSMG